MTCVQLNKRAVSALLQNIVAHLVREQHQNHMTIDSNHARGHSVKNVSGNCKKGKKQQDISLLCYCSSTHTMTLLSSQ